MIVAVHTNTKKESINIIENKLISIHIHYLQ